MDAPPHRLGLERAVEVYSGHDDLVGVTGSGYVLGPDLVLTSGAVVDPEVPCQVRAPWSARWAAAEQVWRGADAVLLRVPESPWANLPGVEHTRWARVVSDAPLRCVIRGFPRAGQRAGFRDAATVPGLVDVPTGVVSKALTVGVPASVRGSLLRGLPGAVLLAEPAGQVVGVIAAGGAEHRLDAIPVTALLGDGRFRELAGVAPGPLETVAEGDSSVNLPGLLVPAREALPQDRADWTLLMARHAVVPFLGRVEELAELRSWAAGPAALSIAIVTGRSGTGKSRLAGELCAELAEAGWDTGFLPLEPLREPLSGPMPGLDALRPSLLVVDRPEPYSPLLGELIRRLAKHGRNPRIRLLLLVREPGEADWWRRLDTAAGGWLRRLNTTTVQLNTAPLTLSERREHVLAAMKAFAPSRAALPAPPRLDDPDHGLPLHVHVAALLRLRDGDPDAHDSRSEVGGGLFGRFVAHECDRWARVWPDGVERLGEVAARQVVAVLTLTAPTSAELPGLLTAVPGIRGRGVSALEVAGWLGRIFPDGEPLGPDLVAEQFLAGTEDLDALVLAVHDHEGRTAEHLVRMLDVLRLSATRERVRAALWSLVAGRAGKLVAEAVANPATRLGDVLDSALALFAADRHLAEAVATAVTEAPVAAAVRRDAGPGSRALKVTLGELAVRHHRASGARIALAGALTWSSGGLAAVGRVGEAVVAAAESVEIYAAAPPYEEAAGRAEALFGLGSCLLLAGEAGSALKPAQEAAARFRILAEEDPRYAERAARAHHNLACALLEVGRPAEAARAFEAAGGDTAFAADVTGILSVLPNPEPETPPATFPRPPATTPPKALPLAAPPGAPPSLPPPYQAFHPTGSAKKQRRQESKFAIQRPRPVAAAFVQAAKPPSAPVMTRSPEPLAPFEEADAAALPEVAACLAVAVAAAVKYAAPTSRDVAHRLHRIAVWLEERDRPADALVPAAQAVTRLRALAGEEPGLRAMLASAAALPARLHARLDDLDAAERSAAEAVRNLRTLVTLDPDAHRPALAGQLLDLGELLLTDDRPDAALEPLQEAMAVAAEGHAAAQARGRRLLGLCLDELGRTADGRAQLEIAAELYDVLSDDDDGLRHRSEVRARLRRWEAAPPADPAGGRPWLLALVVVRPDEAVRRAQAQLAERRRAVESGGGGLGREQIDAYLSAQAMLAAAWANAGRAGEGFGLAMQAAELLQRQAAPDGPHVLAVGMVAAALGRSLVGLGRHKEAIPHLLTAIESYEPHTGTSLVFRTELAELLILETVALSHAACPSDAEAAADRLVELYAGLVAERLEEPLALAGALRLQGGIRFTRQDPEGALRSVGRALDLLPSDPTDPESPEPTRLLAATCLELGGLCLARLADGDVAMERLAAGTALMTRLGPVPHDLVSVHLLALVRLARLRVREEGPAAGVPLYAQILGMRPLPGTDVLETLIEELSEHVETVAAPELVPPLTAFAEALEREVPLSASPGTHDRYGRCLALFSATAARAGDLGSAVAGAELAVRVYRGLAACSSVYRGPLGSALAALARLRPDDAAGLEQAIDLLGGQQDPALAEILCLYAAELLERGRPVEALAQCERAADLCDELDDPAVAAAIYAQLGATLAALDRPQAALEAITWSLAELDKAGTDVGRVRARAVQVRGRVLRAFGREREALAHLVEALRLFTLLPEPRAAAETAAMIADDLLAAGRPQEAVEYAAIALTGHDPGTVKHALATQRLVRCHMMRGELKEANDLVESLIPPARRSRDDLTYRAVLADSLAQSSELMPLLDLDGGTEAEARAREAIAIYDELLTTGMNAHALHTSRAGACLTLAAALRMRGLAAEAIQPLREAVAALERFSPGNPLQAGLLSRAMLMLGDALMEAGRALEAGLVFHRGTQVTRDELSRAVAHARLGFCQRELGRNDAADAALRASAGLLRGLLAAQREAEPESEPARLLLDVLRGRVTVLERAGRDDDAKAVEDELRRLSR